MAKHNDLGKSGEDAAIAHLIKQGYRILHRNWRSGHFELDIVAEKGDELIVVEVKTRSNTLFSLPEEAVDEHKVRRIVRAADAYVRQYEIDSPVRFDIITAVGRPGKLNIEHIEEAFTSPLF